MNLNKRQKIAAAMITPLFIAVFLFPPWDLSTEAVSWAPLWSPPPKSATSASLLFWEFCGLLVLLGGILFLLRARGAPIQRPNAEQDAPANAG
jgi:hypothetical protein